MLHPPQESNLSRIGCTAMAPFKRAYALRVFMNCSTKMSRFLLFPVIIELRGAVGMIVTTHQPIFLPWPGFFFKATRADCIVLLDGVQYPLGRSWMNRNRLKCATGELWLTVPVHRKGRGLQRIKEVEIFCKNSWIRRHLRSLRQNYAHAPYFKEFFPPLERIYEKGYERLLSLNRELIRFFWDALRLSCSLVLQSELGISGRGTELLLSICSRLKASEYLAFRPAEKYIDAALMEENGVTAQFVTFHPPIYPQLWGDFIYNLSILDLLLNCGPMSSDIIHTG